MSLNNEITKSKSIFISNFRLAVYFNETEKKFASRYRSVHKLRIKNLSEEKIYDINEDKFFELDNINNSAIKSSTTMHISQDFNIECLYKYSKGHTWIMPNNKHILQKQNDNNYFVTLFDNKENRMCIVSNNKKDLMDPIKKIFRKYEKLIEIVNKKDESFPF